MPSSQALTTVPARCMTCVLTRRWWTTRIPTWMPASHLWPSPTPAALSLQAMTTSTATSGTHWRERKLVRALSVIQCYCYHSLSVMLTQNYKNRNRNTGLMLSYLPFCLLKIHPFLLQGCSLAMITGWVALVFQMMEWASAQDPGTASSNCGTKAFHWEENTSGRKEEEKIWGGKNKEMTEERRHYVKTGGCMNKKGLLFLSSSVLPHW